ncbi:hypothetical protein Vadar_016389 [Vaccinium darrowii]|uniref:Uncharacterized protein n=1 Tax=Vaccinium darrowii TaxID=229202 RepID=A0ACB7XR18_9ERIC|nr:hypothetical protein Vadar_016389 [Vaccinium darrowii]
MAGNSSYGSLKYSGDHRCRLSFKYNSSSAFLEWVLEKEGEAVESSNVEEKKDLEPINECKYDSKVADVPDAQLNISIDSNVSSSEIGSSTRVIEKVSDSYVERLETQGQGGNALIDMAIISEEHASIDTGFNKRNIDVDIQDVFSANETLNEVCEPNQNEVAELGRSKWNGNIGNFGIVFRAETPLGNFGRPSFTVQLNGGTKF